MSLVARHSPGGRRRPVGPVVTGTVVLLAAAAGCSTLPAETDGELAAHINVSSTMMREKRPLPDAYTCRGEGVSPPLQWSGLPDDDRIDSLAVVVDDPEEATVHWVLYGLDPELAELRQDSVPQSGKQGQNTAGKVAYEPPCPEEGESQEFRFTVYALDDKLDLADDAPLDNSLKAIAAHSVARGSLTTTSE